MLYHLFEYFNNNHFDFPGVGLMQYISFRSICCSIVAIITSMFIGKKIILFLQKKQIGEEIRDLGLEGQISKKGTPTMGGIIILISILIPILLFGDLTNVNILLLILTTVSLGLLGFADDYIKVFKHKKEGLSGKYKIAGQVCLGLVVGLVMCFSNSLGFREQPAKYTSDSVISESTAYSGYGEKAPEATVKDLSNNTKTTIPFVKNNEFDYKWLSPFDGKFGEHFQWFMYILVIIFVITACSNGTNLTDGMDGLATGISAIVGATLGILAYLSGHVGYAEYLNIMYIPNSGEITVFFAAFIGALLGFLWYNSYPAQVFMGDTGSLALGGIIGVCAILIRKELLLPILCGIFFVESLSVIIQRCYFKYTRKKYGEGRRVFKMTPLHHHFQKEGVPALIQRPKRALPEAKIVTRFWIVSILLAVLTVVTLKIR
ncbi:MAG: phospho-N-acetylmuramoyl-pentapeptide-transferase [Bacteroidales bacterium]|nr:phospho-N-acetylmuramoyl-pentapeptide-transferase [Bacteroidales bacterium]MDD4669877.1 phospho-N-acetylmuramoyl-pentapeptide-transferase [Bacteroidales bacterium]